MPQTEIYIIRHGETEFNRKKMVQGSGVDKGLNHQGRHQARQFYLHYRSIPFDLILCSGLKRTYQTIKPFLALDIPLIRLSDLNEIRWGAHEGKKTTPEMIRSYNRMIAQWGRGNLDARLEHGESAAMLIQRMKNVRNVLRQLNVRTLLICTHGRALRALNMVLNEESVAAMETYAHRNTGLYRYRLEDNIFKILASNDTRHLVD